MKNRLFLKNRIFAILLTLAVMLSFTGCGGINFTELLKKRDSKVVASEDINSTDGLNNGDDANESLDASEGTENGDGKIVSETTNGEDLIVVEKIQEIDYSEAIDKMKSAQELPSKDITVAAKELIGDGSKFYSYSQLNEKEQLLYAEILGILNSLSKDIKISSLDVDEIDKVFNCVLTDHPELFYITGYSYTKFVRGEKLEKITLSGTYTMNKKEIEAANKRIEEYTKRCMDGYLDGSNEYRKIKYVYDYLIKNNEYDLAAPNNQNILSVVDEGRTVCQGYAKMTQYILNKMGVFCTLCEGVVKGSESHVWNIVKVNDSYYHVDTTWGDASYNLTSDSDVEFEVPEVNYDYLCITDEEVGKNHVIKPLVPLPQCTSMEANYYVEEDLYFTELNIDQIKEAFRKALDRGERYVTFKCANANVCAAMHAHLIDDQNIFNYVENNGNINYVEFMDELKISFYL